MCTECDSVDCRWCYWSMMITSCVFQDLRIGFIQQPKTFFIRDRSADISFCVNLWWSLIDKPMSSTVCFYFFTGYNVMCSNSFSPISNQVNFRFLLSQRTLCQPMVIFCSHFLTLHSVKTLTHEKCTFAQDRVCQTKWAKIYPYSDNLSFFFTLIFWQW